MGCGPYTKIGRSSNIDNRLAALKAGCPYLIELIGVLENGGDLEHEYHKEYAHAHHTGEWFSLSSGEIENILTSWKRYPKQASCEVL